MSNTCLVTIELTMPDVSAAEDLCARLDDEAADGPMFLTSDARCVFDGQTSRCGDTVTVTGITKWDLNAYAFLRIVQLSGCSAARAWYRQDGDRLFGRYEWGGETMRCWQLQDDDWPEAPDTGDQGEDWYAMHELLQSALDRCPLTWEATPAQIEADERAYRKERAAAWRKAGMEDESCSQSHT